MSQSPRFPSPFLALPFEIRQQIYTLLLSNLTITPVSSHHVDSNTTATPVPLIPIRLQTYTHPNLALLQTSRAIRAEALPTFTSTATLCLRHPSQHLLLTQSAHRVPSLTQVTRLHLSAPLLDHYDALTLNTALFALRRLKIGLLCVKVPHDALARLDAKRDLFAGGSGSGSGEGGGGGGAGAPVSEVQLDLITRLIARLDPPELADKVMKLLAAGRQRGWNVQVGFDVECMSEGRLLLAGEEGSRHVCAFGGLEVGYELVGRARERERDREGD